MATDKREGLPWDFPSVNKTFPYGLNGVVVWVPKSACEVISRSGKAIDLKIESRKLEKKFGGNEKRG